MTKILKTAIIGCGRVAGHHARSIGKLAQFQLVAVCDLIEDRARILASQHNVPFYLNYYDMLSQNPEIDLVAIITPSGMHFEHTLDIIQNYRKHVIVEKPIALKLSHVKLLAETADKVGVKIFPVFQYRFNKCVQRVKRAISDGELGDIRLATVRTRWCRPQRYYDRDPWRGTFSHDGGATTNQGIHHIDLLRYFSGEVKRVHAKMATLGVNIEVEDTAVAILEFESGALGIIEITTAARPEDFESSISIVGSKGLAMVGGWATNELIRFSPNQEEQKLCSEVFPDVYGFGHKEIYLGAFNCLMNSGKEAVEYDETTKSLRLLHALYVSHEINDWVNVAEGRESSRLGEPNEKIANIYRTQKLV